ncbi:MAG: hypothetical protein XD91_0216 [Clostridiales bacterium 38_11]|nr:MAG: hypothetical protein XD91_0216 [Clostridiales bacterium 38_11]HBH12158.1 hypothetical protein [Clostridiales bacterium]
MIRNIYSYIDCLKEEERFIARRILDLVIELTNYLTEIFSMFKIENLSPDIKQKDVLGSLLSLGINRNIVGDIFLLNVTHT